MSIQVRAVNHSDNKDSARNYKWDCAVTFPGVSHDILNMRITTRSLPQPTINVIDVNIRGFTKKEAGAVDWNDLDVTYVEFEDWSLFRQLYDYHNKQFHHLTGIQHRKSEIAGMDLVMLEDLQDGVPEQWCCYGALMPAIQTPSMGNEKGAAVEVPFTIVYDYALFLGSTTNITI